MSAPTTHDPLTVTTADGTTWVRRATTRDGAGLYAVADAPPRCPEFVMATLAELAEHRIVGQADVLPMPVGSPVVDRLRARIAELETERHTTNAALSEAAEALRAHRDRIAELLEQRDAAPVGALREEIGDALIRAGGVADTVPALVRGQAGTLADAVMPVLLRALSEVTP